MDDGIYNLPKGCSGYSWFFEQQTYFARGFTRALKSSEGSGNIPKVVLIEDDKDNN